MQTALRIAGLSRSPGGVRLRLPRWARGENPLSAPEGVTVASRTLAGGLVEAVLTAPDGRDEVVATMSSLDPLPEPAGEPWEIPLVVTPGLLREGDVVIVSGGSWRPQPGTGRPIDASEIPAWGAAGMTGCGFDGLRE